MKEMIKALIDDGWEWVACDKDGTAHLFEKSPVELSCSYVRQEGNNKYYPIPTCLFPDITFENSPLELKTLLVDNEEEEQKSIRMLIENDYSYLVRKHNNEIGCLKIGEEQIFYNCLISSLGKHVPKKYEKVYLKDLVKKRKVKKSVWLCLDKDGIMRLCNTKPFKSSTKWDSETLSVCFYDRYFAERLGLSWEGEPIELTYEVEE